MPPFDLRLAMDTLTAKDPQLARLLEVVIFPGQRDLNLGRARAGPPRGEAGELSAGIGQVRKLRQPVVISVNNTSMAERLCALLSRLMTTEAAVSPLCRASRRRSTVTSRIDW